MKIGLVGYQGSGKSTLFHWLTGVEPDPAQSHVGQTAMATIPDDRIEQLVEIYNPKKITRAGIEIVDTPGLDRSSHEGNAQRLAMIREAHCLVLVVAAYAGGDPMAALSNFEEDLMLADMAILSGRIERVEESMKKPLSKVEREQATQELETLKMVLEGIESGTPIREDELTDTQRKFTKAFRLLTEKRRMVIVNTADDEPEPERFTAKSTDEVPVLAIPAKLEVDLAEMDHDERAVFLEEFELESSDREEVIIKLLETSGYKVFFTAGDKEVRTWLIPRGTTAVEAAGGIHTDLARGFIRAEIMTVADLVRLGGEREVKAAGLARQEPKDYVLQDDDVVLIKFNV